MDEVRLACGRHEISWLRHLVAAAPWNFVGDVATACAALTHTRAKGATDVDALAT